MRLNNKLFDKILDQAKDSPRKRMHYDMRTQAMEITSNDNSEPWKDMSQRMLNVLLPETKPPIHKHSKTTETVVICRGAVIVEFYAPDGTKTEEFLLEAGGDCVGVQIPRDMYHTLVCLEAGSVVFEAKDRPYDPIGTEEFMKIEKSI